jgi:TIR domain
MKHVFITHCHKDRKFVNQLAIDLRVANFSVWYDLWQLKVGDSIIERIQEGIQKSSWLVVVLSPDSVRSKWVKQELYSALSNQLAESEIYVLPILLRDCDVPVFLRDSGTPIFGLTIRAG